jgi:hypothetical protein
MINVNEINVVHWTTPYTVDNYPVDKIVVQKQTVVG